VLNLHLAFVCGIQPEVRDVWIRREFANRQREEKAEAEAEAKIDEERGD